MLGSNITRLLVDSKANVISSFNLKSHNKKKKYFKNLIFLDIKDCIKATKNKDIVYIVVVKGSGILNLKKIFLRTI